MRSAATTKRCRSPTALAVARHVAGAELVVAGMGPGVVGTGTGLGTTAVEAANLVDVAAALGGRPVLCVRTSDGDARPRHRGTSHHTDTVRRLIRTTDVPAPAPGEVPEAPAVGPILDRLGVSITTMGRGPESDPAFFAACSAAATVAVDLLP